MKEVGLEECYEFYRKKYKQLFDEEYLQKTKFNEAVKDLFENIVIKNSVNGILLQIIVDAIENIQNTPQVYENYSEYEKTSITLFLNITKGIIKNFNNSLDKYFALGVLTQIKY